MFSLSVQSDALDLEYESQAMKEKPSSRKFPISLSLNSTYCPLSPLPSLVLGAKMCPIQIQHRHFVNLNDFRIEETMPWYFRSRSRLGAHVLLQRGRPKL